MSKDLCGIHCLSTKKSTMTKVKPREHVHFMSNLIQHKLWPIRHGLLHIVWGQMIRIIVMLKVALTQSWSIPDYWHFRSTNNDRHLLHAWPDKDYSSPGMFYALVKILNSAFFLILLKVNKLWFPEVCYC